MEREIEFIPDDAERLLSLEEVGERLGTGRPFVARLVGAGLMPALTFRRIKRVSKSALARFVKKYEGQDVHLALEAAEREKEKAKAKAGKRASIVDLAAAWERRQEA